MAFQESYTRLLSTYVSPTGVDYPGLKAHPEDLRQYLSELATIDLGGLSANQQKALYLNAYNAFTLSLIVTHYPLSSIRDLGNPWTSEHFELGSGTITLDQIENQHLRPLGDPRIHAAINCASRSCPPLQPSPFRAEILDSQLESVAKGWAQSQTLAGNVLTVSSIFDWYGEDFERAYKSPEIAGRSGKEAAALRFVAHYWPEKAALLLSGQVNVVFGTYDWSLNERR